MTVSEVEILLHHLDNYGDKLTPTESEKSLIALGSSSSVQVLNNTLDILKKLRNNLGQQITGNLDLSAEEKKRMDYYYSAVSLVENLLKFLDNSGEKLTPTESEKSFRTAMYILEKLREKLRQQITEASSLRS